MKKTHILFLVIMLMSRLGLYSQVYPPLEFNISQVTSPSSGTVDVNVTAGTNWQNVTTFNGTFTFDPAIITWNSMQNWGLSFPQLASFSSPSAGVVTFTWNSLITVGPTLSNGSTIFTLRFNVVGNPGDVSPVSFTGSPQAMYWYNGFGWSGNNFLQNNGSVTLICATPVASFTSAANLYNYNFTSTGSGATQYLWDFGDGGSSTLPNPSHTYASSGSYTACLISTNVCGADTVCQTLNVCPQPVTNYTYSINQLAVAFSGTSTNNTNSWLWNFGDGNTSTLQNPNHTYAAPGFYTACLVAGNGCGTDTACYTFTVGCPLPVAAFNDSIDGLNVVFTDLSTSGPTAWFWDFGDGSFSSLPSPFHYYAAPGSYQVCLITSSICGADTSCRLVTVTCAAPEAAFSEQITGATVLLSDLSTNAPTTWAWDFGDGGSSSLQNPSHTYPSDGTYHICLTASSICGADSSCSTVTINTVGLEDDWRTALQVFPNPTSDLLRIVYPGDWHLRLLGLHGELIAEYTATDGLTLSMAHLPRGLYFLEIGSAEGLAVQKILLK